MSQREGGRFRSPSLAWYSSAMAPREIPIVDLAHLGGTPTEREKLADDLRVAFSHYGLVYVRSHGVDGANVGELYEDFLKFCASPQAAKEKLNTRDLWYQRGWTPPNTETAVVAGGQPDFKECYFAAPEPVDPAMKRQYPQICADNVWPDGLPGFDARYLKMGHALHEAGVKLLRGAALSLGLAEDTFTSKIEGGAHVTRLLHYLPLRADQVDTGILWGEEHTDFNLLTLLPGGRFYDADKRPCARPDDKSGLYLRTRATAENPQGELVRGVPPEGCIVAQVGQELEILTAGKFLATPHVVTAPGKPGFSRMSSAHFVHLHPNAIVYPLPSFDGPEADEYGPAVLAGTYAIKTLVDIGLAPRTALDKLGYRHYGRLGAIRTEELEKSG